MVAEGEFLCLRGRLGSMEVDNPIFGDGDANPERPPDVTVNEDCDSDNQVGVVGAT